MKRTLTILILCSVLLGCSKEEDSEKDITFNPPEWLHGTWEYVPGNYNNYNVREILITSHSVRMITGDGNILDYEELAKRFEAVEIEEVIDDSWFYSFNFVFSSGGHGETYVFELIESNKVRLSVDNSAVDLTRK